MCLAGFSYSKQFLGFNFIRAADLEKHIYSGNPQTGRGDLGIRGNILLTDCYPVSIWGQKWEFFVGSNRKGWTKVAPRQQHVGDMRGLGYMAKDCQISLYLSY